MTRGRDGDDRAGRLLREELALEIDHVLRDLELRREVLRDIWSVHRDRGGFIDSTVTRYDRLPGRQLLVLGVDAVGLLDTFYRRLADFRLYLSFTDDMPATLFARYDRAVAALERAGRGAIDALGGLPDRSRPGTFSPHDEILAFFRPKRVARVIPEGEE